MLLSKRISQKNLTYGGIWNLALAASEYVLLCQHTYFCTKAAIKLSSKTWKRRKLALAPSVFVLLYQQLHGGLLLSLLALLVQKYKYWHLKEKEASVLCARLLVAACSVAGRNHIHELHVGQVCNGAELRQYLYFCSSSCVSICTLVLVKQVNWVPGRWGQF